MEVLFTMVKKLIICLVLFGACSKAQTKKSKPVVTEQNPQKKLHPYSVCGKKVFLEEVRKEDGRNMGLMYRDSIKANHGMIFIFNDENPRAFWMKNVNIELDIGYFNSKKRYVSHTSMAIESPLLRDDKRKRYPSSAPAMYAIEFGKGFYSKISNLRSCRFRKLTN